MMLTDRKSAGGKEEKETAFQVTSCRGSTGNECREAGGGNAWEQCDVMILEENNLFLRTKKNNNNKRQPVLDVPNIHRS